MDLHFISKTAFLQIQSLRGDLPIVKVKCDCSSVLQKLMRRRLAKMLIEDEGGGVSIEIYRTDSHLYYKNRQSRISGN